MTDNELKVIPEYSPEGFLGYQVLFDSYDDLIVYIEDSKGVHIYETIINRLFGNSLTINHINAVGGKKNLEEIYRESLKNKLDKNKKACFFIADLDFDQLLNKKTIIDDNFVYLKRYSIENYLVDEKVGVAFINGRNNEGAFNCKNRLNFSSWQDNLTQQMRRLILIFATIQSLDLG
ncbi:DUF4435 domain-containing protein, partial [Paenibacillus sp. 2RAB27]|uniref:DUF4435 domain-containing protein n=1 Tax=Paenibacillus sp. 2RAB27 TaxID=3232991 RepID=UPI003F9CCFF4